MLSDSASSSNPGACHRGRTPALPRWSSATPIDSARIFTCSIAGAGWEPSRRSIRRGGGEAAGELPRSARRVFEADAARLALQSLQGRLPADWIALAPAVDEVAVV